MPRHQALAQLIRYLLYFIPVIILFRTCLLCPNVGYLTNTTVSNPDHSSSLLVYITHFGFRVTRLEPLYYCILRHLYQLARYPQPDSPPAISIFALLPNQAPGIHTSLQLNEPFPQANFRSIFQSHRTDALPEMSQKR